MKKILLISFQIVLIFIAKASFATTIDSTNVSPFGKVILFHPDKTPDAVVLFISGDGGWTAREATMAKLISQQGALVVGVDIARYFKALKTEKVKCYYPASDFENLSMTLQKKYKFTQYYKPILIGYSSGATLVYGMLVQAPTNTFKGAIALGFSPDIDLDKPLCGGSGLTSHVLKDGKSYYLEATKKLSAPLIVLQGTIDQVCSFETTKKYLTDMPKSELVALPNVGHGFSVTKNSQPQLIAAYQKLYKEPAFNDKMTLQNILLQPQQLTPLKTELPLTIIPSATNETTPLVFFISGDGGWSSFDHGVSEKLASEGMPIVGLDSQKYFWNAKQPKETADEVAKAVVYYMKEWNRSSFIIVGYSFGACVAPFIANNFPAPLKPYLKGVFCLSPDETGDFEIHVADMLSISTKEKYNVLNEMKAIESVNPVCIFGTGENTELQNKFTAKGIKVETLAGGHHYNNDYKAVVDVIFKNYTHIK